MDSQPSSPDPLANDPYRPPADMGTGMPDGLATARDAYNIVSDTVVGVNVRKSDNLFQLKAILVCLLVGVLVGAVAGALLSDPDDRLVGALAAGLGLGFAGMVLGLFGSGIYLMVYRAVRHMKGKHD